MTDDARRDTLIRAKGYPYDLPKGSYILYQGEPVSFRGRQIDMDGRVPVLSYGSNASPQQLKRKFPNEPEDRPILVAKTVLKDFDVVYSAHFTSYGALPATLVPSEGTRLSTFVLWLLPVQLEALHATELGNYDFGRLRGLMTLVDGGGVMKELFLYRSRAGALTRNGEAVALAEVPAEGRKLTALGQEAMLEAARQELAPTQALDDFIVEIARNESARDIYRKQLGATALKPKLPRWAKLLPETK